MAEPFEQQQFGTAGVEEVKIKKVKWHLFWIFIKCIAY